MSVSKVLYHVDQTSKPFEKFAWCQAASTVVSKVPFVGGAAVVLSGGICFYSFGRRAWEIMNDENSKDSFKNILEEAFSWAGAYGLQTVLTLSGFGVVSSLLSLAGTPAAMMRIKRTYDNYFRPVEKMIRTVTSEGIPFSSLVNPSQLLLNDVLPFKTWFSQERQKAVTDGQAIVQHGELLQRQQLQQARQDVQNLIQQANHKTTGGKEIAYVTSAWYVDMDDTYESVVDVVYTNGEHGKVAINSQAYKDFVNKPQHPRS